MSPPRKTLAQYESEAVPAWNCLLHPTEHIARVVYQMRHGVVLPTHILVCHHCDTPLCIKDAHHFLGTKRDNVLDAVKKGRHSCFRKGGVGFSGTHTEAVRRKIGEASRSMWSTLTDEERKARKKGGWKGPRTAEFRALMSKIKRSRGKNNVPPL